MAKKSTLLAAINSKVVELMTLAAETKADETLSKNTRQTKSYNLRKDAHTLQVMGAFLEAVEKEDINLSGDLADWFTQATQPKAEAKVYEKVVVNKGDSLMALLQKYSDRKDAYNKILKAAEEAGLKVNMVTGVIE